MWCLWTRVGTGHNTKGCWHASAAGACRSSGNNCTGSHHCVARMLHRPWSHHPNITLTSNCRNEGPRGLGYPAAAMPDTTTAADPDCRMPGFCAMAASQGKKCSKDNIEESDLTTQQTHTFPLVSQKRHERPSLSRGLGSSCPSPARAPAHAIGTDTLCRCPA
jgi:hypothetical protein